MPDVPDVTDDPRRRVPRTDDVLRDPRLVEAVGRLGAPVVKASVTDAQDRARRAEIAVADVADAAVAALPDTATGMRRVVNATGVVLHTNLGRAALSPAAVAAVTTAAGATDVELDLATGRRARRGRSALAALGRAVPDAQAVHVVNNGAAALVLVTVALARDREILISRGELVEIGDGFRIPDLLVSAGGRLREVGTTNRTTLADYEQALGPDTALVLKVHPSNFVVRGFTSSVPVDALATLGVPVVVDIGSGLLEPHPRLPGEPDARSALRAGADLVTASGDKLLGGPQCGLLLGHHDLVDRLRRHPMARALRVDKLTLAALEATLRGPQSPTAAALRSSYDELRTRAEDIARQLTAAGLDAYAVASDASVGGGGAPDVVLPSAAVSLPSGTAESLRAGPVPVVGRVHDGRCLLDLLAVDPVDDRVLVTAVLATRPPRPQQG
ncbi:MAG: L-seryl-tRNA(Sec) selenium transferase [Actinomycetes bacterium]